MMLAKKRILIVDDEKLNLDLLEDVLEEENYDITRAEDGQVAWDTLQKDANFSAILLDRMMPNMDGMETLKRIQANDSLSKIPVIMQTAASSTKQIQEGIDAGVFYYLTKPFSENFLLSIVASAIEDSENSNELISGIRDKQQSIKLSGTTEFEFKTLNDVQFLSHVLASGFEEPEKVITGISELMVNAVEHGNLEITYDEKKSLFMNGNLDQEIKRRINLPKYSDRIATVKFEKTSNQTIIHIKDQGKGFDWKDYMEISMERATDPNGRGIALANSMSFDEIKYLGCGNEVLCIVNNNA